MKQSGGLRPIAEWTVKKPLLMASVSNPCSEKAGAWASVGCAPGPSDAVGTGALARARPGVRTMQHLEARCHQSRLLLGATCAARTSCLSRTVQSTATCTFAVRCSSVQALRQAATKVWVTKVGDQDRTARNLKYALIRCLRSVWMGSSPSRKLKNAIGKCASGSTPYCAQRPNRQQPGPQVAGARARGRLLCLKPITRASDHAQKLTVSPELLVVLWSPAL